LPIVLTPEGAGPVLISRFHWVHFPEQRSAGVMQSLMAADFISAGCQSADGSKLVCVGIKPGKNQDGYFSNDDLLAHVQYAVDLIRKFYLNDDYVFLTMFTHAQSK
jgi:hypothetical protein